MTTTPTSGAELRLNQQDPNLAPVRFSVFLFTLVVVLYVAARFWRLTSSCLWFDEIFGVHAARHNWTEMFKFVAADIIHPPLFYALLKVWIGIGGESLLWLRLLPVVFSVAAIVPLVLLARELRLGENEKKLALTFLAVNGYLIKYAQEVRMYSLLFLLTCASIWLFVKFINARNSTKMLLALAVINFLLVYTHYYGWLVVIVELLTLLLWWRHRAAKLLLTILALILSYLPWLYLITISKEPGRGLAQNIGWVARPGPGDVAQFFSMLNTPFFFRQSSVSSLYDVWSICLSLLIFGLPLAALLREALMKREAGVAPVRVYWWLTSLAFLPVLLAFLLSWVLPHSIWGTRHLIVAAGPYAILAALALVRLRPTWARTACLVLLSCWLTLNGAVFLFQRPTSFIWCTWEPLAQQMMKSEDGSREVQIYAYEDLVAYHLWFALDTARRQGAFDRFKVHVVKGIPGLREDPAYFLPRRFYGVESQDGAALKGESVWIAFRDSVWHTQRPPLSLIEAQGYETGRVFELPAQGQRAFLVELRRTGQTR
ncbi:MAG: glycosyltransferase family 39 protein [Pyrinomonadaceae bacterium]